MMKFNSSNSLLTVPTGPLKISELPPNHLGTSAESIHLSLVIPTYKERENIQNVVCILSQLLDESISGNYELIVVDDDSPDRTWEIAQSLTQEYPQLRVMRRQQERGLSSAVIRGWQAATGNVLGVIDGDFQHPPEVLMQLLRSVEQGADLAVASRHVEGGGVSSWSVVRRLLSRGAQLLGLVILPRVLGRVSDPMSGYFMVRRSAIANTTLNPVGYKILLEVIGRGKIDQIAEVGYVFCERQEGESKVTWKQYIDYIHHLVRLRLSPSNKKQKLTQQMAFPIGRFLRFGLVGLSGVFVDMTILYLLSDPTTLAWPLTRSKIIAGEIAILNNFFWNDAWTFADVSARQQEWHQRLKRFLKFNAICLAGLALNVLVLNLVYNFILPYLIQGDVTIKFAVLNLDFNFIIRNTYIANLIAIAVATIWNFWINLKLSWRVTDVK